MKNEMKVGNHYKLVLKNGFTYRGRFLGQLDRKIDFYDWKIKDANEKGWKNFLEKMNIIPQISYLDPRRRGIYFNVNSVKNVSGVIGIFRGRNPVFLPNPFAYKEINDPKLVDYLDLNKT